MAVSYSRTTWKNRVVERPRTYMEATNPDGSRTDSPAPGEVIQAGTPLNQANLNNIEQGIVDCVAAINDTLATIETLRAELAEYNTRIQNNERSITAIQTVNETQSADIRAVRESHNALAEDEEALEGRADGHIARTDNPHTVTKTQVGLGNVPNVSTNNQTPTYTEAASDANLASGEKLSVAMGKIARAVKALWAHVARTDNPHAVTKAQVSLGNVPNVSTNNQTPTYTEAAGDANLASGETLSVAFGKIKRAITRLGAHIADTDNPHMTGLYAAAAMDFIGAWGPPAAVGQYIGNGSNAGTVIVNGKERIGQFIDVGFAPSKVAILIGMDDLTIGHSEDELRGVRSSALFEDLFLGAHMGIALFGPLLNYYHSDCGNAYRQSPPEDVLSKRHGGAVVYGNGFIVQSHGINDTEHTMWVNNKGQSYTYLAWR